MFPTVRVSFSGPMRGQPSDRYAVIIDVVATDARRYRYAYHRSSWLVAGKADPPAPARLYTHPDTPLSSDALRKQVISFEKVKLTNNEMDKSGQVGLQCTHFVNGGPTRDAIKLLSRKHIYGRYRDKKWMDIYLCDTKIVMRALTLPFYWLFSVHFPSSLHSSSSFE